MALKLREEKRQSDMFIHVFAISDCISFVFICVSIWYHFSLVKKKLPLIYFYVLACFDKIIPPVFI